MKAKLKARFLPPTYIQNNYSLLHHVTQGTMSVEEYTGEFEKLLIKCDLQEVEEQTIVRKTLSMLMWLNSKPLPLLMRFVC